MREPDEILAFITDCEQKINKLKSDVNSLYEALEVQVAPLTKELEEKIKRKRKLQ